MVRSVVFLLPRGITPRDERRWGFDTLRTSGVEPRAVDLSALVGEAAPSGTEGGLTEQPVSLREFAQFVRAEAGSAVFIDYLRGISGPDLRTAPIFRILRDAGAIYYVIAAGSLPVTSRTPHRWLRAVTRPGRAVRHVGSLVSRLAAERFGGYAPPFKVFGPPAPAVSAFASRHGIPAERLIATHSLDYDGQRRSDAVALELPPCCVFIDDGLAGHPDFDALRRRAPNAARYFADLGRVFDRIEAAVGLPVVVARHPRSDALRPEVIGGRRVLEGGTADAVAASRLVLGHASTALGYAALARKPVLLIGGRHVADAGLAGAVTAMADALGAPVIDPDDLGALAALRPDLSRVPVDRYARYVEHHVRPSDAPEESLWRIVAQHALVDLHGTAASPVGGP